METVENHTIEFLEKRLDEQSAEIAYLKEQLAWFKKQLFGKKSERIIEESPEQLVFEGFENLQEQEEKQTIAVHKRKKRTSTGKDTIQLGWTTIQPKEPSVRS